MDKLNLATGDIYDENVRKLGELFPDVVTEVQEPDGTLRHVIDTEALQAHVGDVADDTRERYQFTWPGKREAKAEAHRRIDKAMRPCPEKSVDWDTTGNLYIEGDNLDALKILRDTYAGKVKMIYIDPPYNTGHDFVYNDDRAQSVEDYEDASGAFDDEGRVLDTAYKENTESNGRFHSDWCSMMYPRLMLARDLLSEDGLILINMDENEYVNLQNVMREIFGEDNDLGTIVWDKRNPKGDATGIAMQHEYILVYARQRGALADKSVLQRPKKNAQMMINKAASIFSKISLTYSLEDANRDFKAWVRSRTELSGGERAYNNIDKQGRLFQPVSMAWPNKKKAPDDYFIPLIHPVTGKHCPVPPRGWRNPSSTMKALLDKDLIVFGPDESTQPRRKYLLEENMMENIPSLLYNGGSDTSMLEEMGIPFDTPKVTAICQEHIQSLTSGDSLILDFFSGSATTAHAVMQLNAEDGGNRRFIMVQLPEVCDEKSEAAKAGYRTICEIGEERIRRAGRKIAQEVAEHNRQLKLGEEPRRVPDVGFRVLRIDSSNLAENLVDPSQATQLTLAGMVNNVRPGRTPLDLLFQVLPKFQIPFTARIEEQDIEGRTVYRVDGGRLLACFEPGVPTSVIVAMAKQEPAEVVMGDASFMDDAAVSNFEELFRTYSPGTQTHIL